MLEVRAQAPYDDDFREHLDKFDEYIAAEVRGIVADGVEAGVFRDDTDPEARAEFVVTVFDGAHVRAITAGRPLSATRERLAEYVEENLLADGEDREVEFS